MSEKDRYIALCNTEESIPLFGRPWWLDVVCGASKWDVLLVEEGNNILAAMPLYKPLSNVISMPCYTQTMGPWINPRFEPKAYGKQITHRQECLKKFVSRLDGYSSFLQNFHSGITDWLPFYWGGYNQTTRYSYVLEGINNQEILWDKLSQNIQRNIRSARDKKGIICKKGIPVDDFLKVNAQSFGRQGLAVKGDEQLLKRLIECCRLRNQGELWGAYDSTGQLHAAIFVVWQKSSAYYLAGGEDPALRSSGAGSLLMWEAICSVSRFTDRFDFEGSMLEGVEHYFRKFGTIQTPYFTITRGKMCLLYRAWIKLGKFVTKQHDERDDNRKI